MLRAARSSVAASAVNVCAEFQISNLSSLLFPARNVKDGFHRTLCFVCLILKICMRIYVNVMPRIVFIYSYTNSLCRSHALLHTQVQGDV